jgi:hypothetical protein
MKQDIKCDEIWPPYSNCFMHLWSFFGIHHCVKLYVVVLFISNQAKLVSNIGWQTSSF